jgi:hypothetical protein
MAQMGPYALRDIGRRHRGFVRKVASFPLLAQRSGRQRRRSAAIVDLPDVPRRFIPPLLVSEDASLTAAEAMGVVALEIPAATAQRELASAASQLEDVVGEESAAARSPDQPMGLALAHGAHGQRKRRDPGKTITPAIAEVADATPQPPSLGAGEPAHPEPVDAGAEADVVVSDRERPGAVERTPPITVTQAAHPEERREAGVRPPARTGRGRRGTAPETPAHTLPGTGVPAEPEPPIAPEGDAAASAGGPLTADRRDSLAEAVPDRAELPRSADESLPAHEQPDVDMLATQRAPRHELATEMDPADLFAPVASDRSPATWHARLVEAAERDPAKAGSAATATRGREPQRPPAMRAAGGIVAHTAPPRTEPLAETTRRFLAPLVGLDPSTTRVHRDSAAEAVASAYHADALSAGDDIFVSTRFAADNPESAGLLAHELTHVARGREPGFVPPVTREAHVLLSAQDTTPTAGLAEPQAPEQDTVTWAPSTDDETLATLAEARVTALARTQTEAPLSLQPHEIRMPRSARPAAPALSSAASMPQRAEARDPWGGLPAPWEPLPEWLTSVPDDAVETALESSAITSGLGMPRPYAPPASAGADAPSAATAPVVHRAAADRTVPDASASGVGDVPAAGQHGEPTPDLEALAQQVHAVLKRRLAAERRREG